MRVLLLAPHFAEYSLRLAIELSRKVKVTLFIDRRALRRETDYQLLREVRRAGVRLRLFSARTRGEKLLATCAFLRVMQGERPDVVHSPEYAEPFFTAWLLAARAIAPIVSTVHDPEPHSGADREYARRRRHYTAVQRTIASGFVVHGAYCRRLLERKLQGARPRPIVDAPHGPLLVPSAEQRLEPTARHMLFFGRMEAYKALDVYLAALQELCRRDVRFSAHICGRGPELDRLADDLAQIPGVVIKSRFLSVRQAIAEFQAASVVVAPYRDATQSGVVGSAFGNGRAAVVTRSGGLPDYVVDGENGLLCRVDDPLDLADKLQRVLGDPALSSRLGCRAGFDSSHRLGWAAAAIATRELYARLIQKSAS